MKPFNKTKLIGIERLLITLGIIILIGASFFAGIQLCKLYNELRYFNFEYMDSIGSATRQDLEDSKDISDESEEFDGSSADIIKINLMLNWVIDCESSGIHEDRWGEENEYGILQWKSETWDFLSDKYNYEGDWKNQDDQIELFLLTSEEDKIKHWSCYRKYLKL